MIYKIGYGLFICRNFSLYTATASTSIVRITLKDNFHSLTNSIKVISLLNKDNMPLIKTTCETVKII